MCVFSVFRPASTDDEARDLENQKRMRSFNWITPQHLDAAINPDIDAVQQLIDEAQQGTSHFLFNVCGYFVQTELLLLWQVLIILTKFCSHHIG